MVASLAFVVFGQNRRPQITSPRNLLGLRLFKEARFSSPQGDLQNSCSSCHLFDEDPQGMRAHTDFFARSWVPWRSGDPRREELRNSPTILDAALMPQLHFDGEFSSLEALVKGTLAGRPMGWLPGEQEQAFDRIHGIVVKDDGESTNEGVSYRAEFKRAYGVDIQSLKRNELVDLVAKALSNYMRTLKTERPTPFDRFVQANGLDAGPARGEDPKLFASRFVDKVAALEDKHALKLPSGFDSAALEGMTTFFRANGTASVGNCVTCHTPPLFTDFSFHNMGISQSEYDQLNGDGSFARLEIPAAAQARRPSIQFRETPSKQKPACADLGYWNFVDLKTSPLRRAGEADDSFLARMIATFKTPTLRNLTFSYPYMHTGGFSTIESALNELKRLSEMAREGQVRAGDEELAKIRISEADVALLGAFLKTLDEELKPARRP
jgi:cytochrome c peroxidase